MTTEAVDIAVDKISHVFGADRDRLKVLEKVSFTVNRGELVCIVGPSGCGKTTLLRILLGLVTPTSGSVSIDPVRKKLGTAFIQQTPALLPWRTLLQNTTLGLEIKGELSSMDLERVRAEIRRYGLEGFEDRLPSELSGGMQQRVAIVRALESLPRLLFCDEPFSAVDFVTRLQLNTLFRGMCKNSKITTVFVTHNIEEAIFLGDRVLVLSGRPSRIVGVYHRDLSIGKEDAVLCREAPEFGSRFREIWKDLGRS